MRIALASDLHLEHQDITLDNLNSADVLVLAGDILIADELYRYPDAADNSGVPDDSTRSRAAMYRNFLAHVSSQYKHVVVVAGNHEFYHGRWYQTIDILKKEYAAFSNIHFLERNAVVIDEVTFVGATLWTDLNRGCPLTPYAVQETLNDYRHIRDDRNNYSRLKAYQTVYRHKESLKDIIQFVESAATERVVVVSHHSPCWNSLDPKFANDRLINGAYYSDLSEIILSHPKIKLWCHGHVHYASQYTLGEAVIACNPRGYHTKYGCEDTGWDFSKNFEI